MSRIKQSHIADMVLSWIPLGRTPYLTILYDSNTTSFPQPEYGIPHTTNAKIGTEA